MKTMLKKFWLDEDGGQVVEWPLIAAILALLIIAGWTAFGGGFSTALAAIGGKLSAAGSQVSSKTLPSF